MSIKTVSKKGFTRAIFFIAILILAITPLVPMHQANALTPWETNGWEKISAGQSDTCGLSAGQAYCWGSNSNSTTPVAIDTNGVLAGKSLTDIGVGNSHMCALSSDSQVYCWGSNYYGELGNGSTQNSTTPVAVDTSGVLAGKTITAISTGNQHTCALSSTGQAYCWGYNAYGQLGYAADSITQQNSPVAVTTSGLLSGKTIRAISVGYSYTCAVASDSKAYCWGFNSSGELGNNSTTTSTTPAAVDTSGVLAGKSLTGINTSNGYTCALSSTNQAYCWGENGYGQLGNDSTDNSLTPVAVDTGDKVIDSISNGYAHGCVITSEKQAYCWGWNIYGQLGNNSKENSITMVAVIPVPPVPPTTITDISFTKQDGRNTLILNGVEFPSYVYALSRSLISLNGTPLPFCSTNVGFSAQEIITQYGVPSNLVSDTPNCYYLYVMDSNNAPTPGVTSTQAVIWLSDDFDITAPGTVSIDDSAVFSFNQSNGGGDNNNNDDDQAPTVPVDDKSPIPAPDKSPTLAVTPSDPVVTQDSATPVTIQEMTFKAGDKALTDNNVVLASKPTFSGYATPLSSVTVTVHSDPITCTTTADATGYWSCTLSSSVPEGQHQVFVKIVGTDKQVTNFGPYDVTVKHDAPAVVNSHTSTETEPKNEAEFPWGWISAGVVALGVIVAAIILTTRRRKQA